MRAAELADQNVARRIDAGKTMTKNPSELPRKCDHALRNAIFSSFEQQTALPASKSVTARDSMIMKVVNARESERLPNRHAARTALKLTNGHVDHRTDRAF